MFNLSESKQLQLYKQLLRTMADYEDKFPATGVGKIVDDLMSFGIKSMPTDKSALSIIEYLLKDISSPPSVVQGFLNKRFSNLPINIRPVYKEGNKKLVAFWNIDGKISDRVSSLVNRDSQGGKGFWSDVEGEKVTLVDFINKEE